METLNQFFTRLLTSRDKKDKTNIFNLYLVHNRFRTAFVPEVSADNSELKALVGLFELFPNLILKKVDRYILNGVAVTPERFYIVTTKENRHTALSNDRDIGHLLGYQCYDHDWTNTSIDRISVEYVFYSKTDKCPIHVFTFVCEKDKVITILDEIETLKENVNKQLQTDKIPFIFDYVLHYKKRTYKELYLKASSK